MRLETFLAGVAMAAALLSAAGSAHANGAPIFRRELNPPASPNGTMAAVLPNLQPGRESRLEVLREDLRMQFSASRARHPLVSVSAAYTIKNPTNQDIVLEIGFPILGSSSGRATQVHVGAAEVKSEYLSTAQIQAEIRKHTRQVIESHLTADSELARLVADARAAQGTDAEPGHAALRTFLSGKRGWNERDVILLWGYARLTPSKRDAKAAADPSSVDLAERAFGPLKATQYLSLLANRFDPKTDLSYEALFAAWGGDLRDRAVDFESRAIRPREANPPDEIDDLHTRLDYLERDGVTPAELRACEAVLQQLPVTFSFAPMSLMRTSVRFPANGSQLVKFEYTQYAHEDNASPASYQLGYVVHPASFWDKFGPIHLSVLVPEGVRFAASVPTRESRDNHVSVPAGFALHEGVVETKTGTLFLAVRADEWNGGPGRENRRGVQGGRSRAEPRSRPRK